ncbi:histidine phosphatase family protein [Halorarius litoreus]|uniref:histidine phosphatase family protein n=1 Tax=Halorarius litoreus TaxID=2962676 RepID=UPI0020CE22A7|nr:histidine phosphatase family protein [Halorarius litoreus]
MTTIVVVRHGETAWNREGRMQGWAPVPLNDTGREQAEAAGAWLADRYAFDAVHASDLLRTKETAERLVDPLEFDLADTSYEMAWRERDIGVYQGLTYDDVFDRFPEFGLGEAAVDAADRVPDSGESLVDVYDRVTDRFEAILDEAGPDETRLVVTHGGPVYMLLGHVEDLPIKEAVLDHHIDNCGVTVFEHSEEETRVVETNGRSWA